jgi:hypothetical protein
MSSPFKTTKQNLSPKAKKAKHNRDVAAAKTDKRKARKAENQRIGQNGQTDLHHTKSGAVKRISRSSNRNVWKRNER